jgi:hypothetical protein
MSFFRVILMSGLLLCSFGALAQSTSLQSSAPKVSALAEPFAGTIVALQPDVQVQYLGTSRPMALADIVPSIGRVYVVAQKNGAVWRTAHLSFSPPSPGVRLSEDGSRLEFAAGEACPIGGLFDAAKAAIAPICGGRAELRMTVDGYRNSFDAVTDLLRDRLGGLGEQAISLVKAARGDADKEAADYGSSDEVAPVSEERRPPPDAPLDAILAKSFKQLTIARGDQGVTLADAPAGPLAIGRWYRSANQAGVFVSRITPRAVGHTLDPETFDAAVDLMAVALDGVRLEYRVGTEHPRLDWAKWAQAQGKGPGPDGIGSTAPIARPGIVDPRDKPDLLAVFAGGFKRLHGALQDGTYYGFIEDSVVLTRLRPGLVTLYATADGVISMDSWAGQPASPLLFARQNGIPIVDKGLPGRRLEDRSASWSTGVDGNPRTARGGACLIDGPKRFLVYGYFSSAVPRTMADVFVAYGCQSAMLLDMSRAALAYAAIHHDRGHETLTLAMKRGDPAKGAKFLDQADERDFFALLKSR